MVNMYQSNTFHEERHNHNITSTDSKRSPMRCGSSSVPVRRSSAPVRRNSGWSLAGLLGKDNDNGSKQGIGDDKSSTMTSHDSLSSMFEEDEDMWKEFKAELTTSQVHTSAGVQGVLTKFVYEKRKSQQLLNQQEEDDEGKQNERNSTWEEVDKNAQAKETKNLTLPAASRAEKSYGASIVRSLGGTWLGLDHDVKKYHDTNTSTASYPGLWLDESETSRETYSNVIRGDARSVCGGYQLSSAAEEDEHSSHEHAAVPSASNSNKNLLGLLGRIPKCEKVFVITNNDTDKATRNRRKSDVGSASAQLKRRPHHRDTRLSKSCGPPSSYDQDDITIDINNHIKNWFNNFGRGGNKLTGQKVSSSCEAGDSITSTSSLITDEKALAKRPSPHSIMDEFEGPLQLQAPPFLENDSMSVMPQVNPRSCLKRSSSDINYVSHTSALLDAFDENSDDNKVSTEHLIHMLLSLDSSPPPSKSKEKAVRSKPSNNHQGAKEEEDPPQKLELSQEPAIFKYKPRKKHSRSITTDPQIHKVNSADETASLSSSPSPSLMSTGSINDMRRRHIRKISRNDSDNGTMKKQVSSNVPQNTTKKSAPDIDLLTRYFQNKAENRADEVPPSSQLLVNWPSSDDDDVHDTDEEQCGITITPHEVASKKMSDLTVDGEEIDEIEQLDTVEIRKQCKRNYSIDSIAECLHEDDSM